MWKHCKVGIISAGRERVQYDAPLNDHLSVQRAFGKLGSYLYCNTDVTDIAELLRVFTRSVQFSFLSSWGHDACLALIQMFPVTWHSAHIWSLLPKRSGTRPHFVYDFQYSTLHQSPCSFNCWVQHRHVRSLKSSSQNLLAVPRSWLKLRGDLQRPETLEQLTAIRHSIYIYFHENEKKT